jgi:oligopeptide/dipeptide ABC transporter ATP-binding protein
VTEEKPAILEAVGLSKRFAGVRAVDGVSLAVRRGETLAIVGESGCGKSTLARLLLHLLTPTGGDVRYEGESLSAMSAARLRGVRRELQIVFQDPFASLNPRMRVEAIVGEPIWLHERLSVSARRDRVQDLLRIVGLQPGQASHYPHEFSGGQRQRIAIARALASGPKLILGDEPVSALDVSVQAKIVNLLEDLKDQFDLTLVVIAHGLGLVRHMADRVAVMLLGEIVELAQVDELFETPLHPYTRGLLAAAPEMQPGVRRARAPVEGELPDPAAPPAGCRFSSRCPHVRPLCREARPALDALPSGRKIACHFWAEIAAAGAGAIVAPTPSAAFARRLALFEAKRDAIGVSDDRG